VIDAPLPPDRGRRWRPMATLPRAQGGAPSDTDRRAGSVRRGASDPCVFAASTLPWNHGRAAVGSDLTSPNDPGSTPASRAASAPPLVSRTAGVAVGVIAVAAVLGPWTVTAFLIPWVAAVALLVLPALLELLVVRPGRSTVAGAVVGAVLGIGCVALLLLVQPMAGMAGPLLPGLALTIGAALGAVGTVVGRRVRSPRVAVLLIALAVVGATLVALLGRP
jgi:hypothetical protein